jgi:hypothetical protein
MSDRVCTFRYGGRAYVTIDKPASLLSLSQYDGESGSQNVHYIKNHTKLL